MKDEPERGRPRCMEQHSRQREHYMRRLENREKSLDSGGGVESGWVVGVVREGEVGRVGVEWMANH